MADSRGLAEAMWVVTATFARIPGLMWQRSWPDVGPIRPSRSLLTAVRRKQGRLKGGPLDFDQARSYRTEPDGRRLCRGHYGGVAQLVRALACHARGRGFEPRRSRHRSITSGLQGA